MQREPTPRPSHPSPQDKTGVPRKPARLFSPRLWPLIVACAIAILGAAAALHLREWQTAPSSLMGPSGGVETPPDIRHGSAATSSAVVMPPVINRGSPPARNPLSPDPEPSTQHFIVEDGESGAILFQQNAFTPVAPASLTKIMTALLAIERGHPSDMVRVDVDAAAFEGGSVMGLEAGSEVSLQDLLYGMMLLSGNDAAVAIARHIAGSEEAFVRTMNDKAVWLRLGGTHFANPAGFDADGQYSCPADMVSLARYAMQYPLFREIVSTQSYQMHGPGKPSTIRNVNDILTAYPGADGVKTGDTPRAGRSSVATAIRNGHRVYVAFVRSSNGAVADGILLLDWAFGSHTWAAGPTMPDRR